jgi:hypothetical protein
LEKAWPAGCVPGGSFDTHDARNTGTHIGAAFQVAIRLVTAVVPASPEASSKNATVSSSRTTVPAATVRSFHGSEYGAGVGAVFAVSGVTVAGSGAADPIEVETSCSRNPQTSGNGFMGTFSLTDGRSHGRETPDW